MTEEEKYELYWDMLSKILLELENYQGYSHTDIAQRGGVGRDVVGKLAHGNPLIQVQSFVKICRGLDCPPGYFLSQADELWLQLFGDGNIKKYQRLKEEKLVF